MQPNQQPQRLAPLPELLLDVTWGQHATACDVRSMAQDGQYATAARDHMNASIQTGRAISTANWRDAMNQSRESLR
jgi:hypothetical protein